METRTARFVDVPAARLRAALDRAGEAVRRRGGGFRWTVVGGEEAYELRPPGAAAAVRVLTTLDGGDFARGCGLDAVRVYLVSGDRPVSGVTRVLRTAPRDAADRPGAFLDRLLDRLREAYRAARATPACPACGRAMVRRTGPRGPFLGCVGYPSCRKTSDLGNL